MAKKKDKMIACLTLVRPGEMTDAGRKGVIKWLEADLKWLKTLNWKKELDKKRFRSRYFV